MANFVVDLSESESGTAACTRVLEGRDFEEFYRVYGRRILQTCKRILKEDESAKDALQETAIKVFLKGTQFRGESTLWSWIHRIAVNVSLEMIRRDRSILLRTSEDVRDLHLMDERKPSPFRHLHSIEIRLKLWRAFCRLGPKHRQILILHMLEGFTISEIAKHLQIREGTVKSRIWYAREELRHQLTALSRSAY